MACVYLHLACIQPLSCVIGQVSSIMSDSYIITQGIKCVRVQVMRKKAKPGKGGRGAAPKMLTKLEPVPSFFNFFSPPQVNWQSKMTSHKHGKSLFLVTCGLLNRALFVHQAPH